MGQRTEHLPNPDRAAVALWLKSLSREYIHANGWVDANRRFHEITVVARTFLRDEFPDDEQREAAFDGLTLGLMAMAHFSDVEQLNALFGAEGLPLADTAPAPGLPPGNA